MAINLQKGQRENINAPKFTIGLVSVNFRFNTGFFTIFK